MKSEEEGEGGGRREYTSHKQLCLIGYVLDHLSTAVEELSISLCTH